MKMITPEQLGINSEGIEFMSIDWEVKERKVHTKILFKNGEYKEWHYKSNPTDLLQH